MADHRDGRFSFDIPDQEGSRTFETLESENKETYRKFVLFSTFFFCYIKHDMQKISAYFAPGEVFGLTGTDQFFKRKIGF